MKEKWKTIKEFGNGRYSVSNLGNVRNNETGSYIKGDINNFGYHRVCLYYKGEKKRFMRHRLVAKYFVKGKTKSRKFVNHNDGNKSHNYATNLEWSTQSENEKHAFRTGLKKRTNKPLIIGIGDSISIEFDNQREAAEFFNCSQASISKWLTNKNIIPRNINIINIDFIS